MEGSGNWYTRQYKTLGISQACKESREVFLKYYIPFAARNLHGPPVYVNLIDDMLFIDIDFEDGHEKNDRQIKYFLRDLDSSSGNQSLVGKIKI